MNTQAMNNLSYGLFVLTARDGEKHNGCIVNTVTQVTSSPCRIAIAVNKDNCTHDMIEKTRKLTVSVLSQSADFELIKRFGFASGSDTDKFKGFADCRLSANGTMIVTKGTNAYISADILCRFDLGTHTLFIADVTDAEVLCSEPSLTYEYYHANVKPKPQAAPKEGGKTVWRCKICGFEYEGEELPDDYVCPLCKHPASDFEKVIV